MALGNLRPGLCAHDRMGPLAGGQFVEERFRRPLLLHAAQQSRLEQLRLLIIGICPQAVLDKRIGFLHAVTTFIENRQLKIRVGYLLRDLQHPLKTFHGLIGPKNHPVTLACQVQDVRLLSTQLHQPV